MPKSTSAGNSLSLLQGCTGFEFFCRAATLLSVKAAVAHPPRFSWFSRLFFFFSLRCPHQTKTQWRATREDVLDNHLFRSFFFLSHRRFKRGTLWANKLWTAFPLRQPHNGLPVHRRSSQRTLWLARKICLHLLSHTKKGHGRVPEMTHALTFTIESVSLTDKSSVQTVLYKN